LQSHGACEHTVEAVPPFIWESPVVERLRIVLQRSLSLVFVSCFFMVTLLAGIPLTDLAAEVAQKSA
jgi:hypothetical protein